MTSTWSALSFGVSCASSTLLLCALSGTARAQAVVAELPAAAARDDVQAMGAARGMVRVHVSAGDHPFAVYFGRGARPIADCAGPCGFWAWPAKYRIRVQQGDGPGHDATIALHVRDPGRYVFVPARGKAQNLGLILGVSGPVLGVAGLVFTVAGLMATCDDPPPERGCDRPSTLYIGLTGLAVGSAMTAIGWPLYQYNRAHFQVSDLLVRSSNARLGIVAMPRAGVGLGATLFF